MRARLATTCPVSTAELQDRQRPEAVDDALGHVRGDVHRGGRRAVAGAEQDDAGHHVVHVLGAGLDGAAEDVDEQQHQQHRQHHRHQQRVRVADGVPEAAPDHGDRVGHGVRGGAHRALTAGSRPPAGPVRVRKTSSRVGRCSDRVATSTPASSSRSSSCRMWAAEPSVATRTVRRDRSERTAAAPSRSAARGTSAASSRTSSTCSAPMPRLSSSAGAGGEHPAAVQHRDPVGQPVRLLQVLRGQQDRHPVRDQPADHVPDRLPAARVQPGGRLVQEQHLGAAHQAHRQVDLAPHAAGVGLHPAAGVRAEVEAVQQLVRAPARLGRGQVPEPAHHQQVLLGGQHLVDRGGLPGQADRPAHRGGVAHHVVAGDGGRAGVRRHQRRQDADGRGLAGPVRAEQREHLAAADRQVDPVEHGAPAVRLDQAVRPDGDFAGHRCPPLSWCMTYTS